MFGSSEQDRLLANCFFDQYAGQSGVELHSLLENLAKVELPFDLLAQMRRQDFPGFHGFECGAPSKYYYFVPNTCYGGHKPFPESPLDPSFVAAVDGIGLNFGCPLRLKLALEALLALPDEFQKEARHGLASSTKHLATIEELICARIWKSPFSVSRPSSGAGKNHDWIIHTHDVTLNLECKFVPASWAKIVDGADFDLMRGSLAKKASAQLPKSHGPDFINVVAVTGIALVDDGLRRLCWNELNDFPNVEAIVYSDVIGQIVVFSLSASLAHKVHSHIVQWPADRFGGFSTVTFCRPETERRSLARKALKDEHPSGVPSELVELQVEPLAPRIMRPAPPEEYPYRFELVERLPTGEPVIRWIPPFL